MEKLNLTQQKYTFANQNKCTATENKHNKCSAVAEMDDRLATLDMGRKLAAVPLMGVTWIAI